MAAASLARNKTYRYILASLCWQIEDVLCYTHLWVLRTRYTFLGSEFRSDISWAHVQKVKACQLICDFKKKNILEGVEREEGKHSIKWAFFQRCEIELEFSFYIYSPRPPFVGHKQNTWKGFTCGHWASLISTLWFMIINLVLSRMKVTPPDRKSVV